MFVLKFPHTCGLYLREVISSRRVAGRRLKGRLEGRLRSLFSSERSSLERESFLRSFESFRSESGDLKEGAITEWVNINESGTSTCT